MQSTQPALIDLGGPDGPPNLLEALTEGVKRTSGAWRWVLGCSAVAVGVSWLARAAMGSAGFADSVVDMMVLLVSFPLVIKVLGCRLVDIRGRRLVHWLVFMIVLHLMTGPHLLELLDYAGVGSVDVIEGPSFVDFAKIAALLVIAVALIWFVIRTFCGSTMIILDGAFSWRRMVQPTVGQSVRVFLTLASIPLVASPILVAEWALESVVGAAGLTMLTDATVAVSNILIMGLYSSASLYFVHKAEMNRQ
jgi:hypothetical protein